MSFIIQLNIDNMSVQIRTCSIFFGMSPFQFVQNMCYNTKNDDYDVTVGGGEVYRNTALIVPKKY